MAELTKRSRPDTLEGKTFKIETIVGNLYLTINYHDGVPFEVFVRVGKAGDEVMVLCEAIGRMVSLSLRYGIPVAEIAAQLQHVGGDWPITPSVVEAISRALAGAPAKRRAE